MFIFLPANVIYLDSLQLCSQHSFQKGMTVKGIVTDTRKSPISGVVVTDGVHFTQTDEKGYYYLPSDFNQSKFVYVSVPADYQPTVKNALPTGYYARLDQSKRQTDMISN